MKKGIIAILCFFVLALLFAFGCTKTNPTEPDPQPAASITPTVTAQPTSTPAASPNLSGTITFPADAVGKQFAVMADTDTNTANGNTAVFYGTINAVTEDYLFEVPAGSYYIYAFVDMNGSGLISGPGGLDYIGDFNNWSAASTGSTGLDFNCNTKIKPVITVNLTLPADAAGRDYFLVLLSGNTLADLGEKPVGQTSGIAPAGTQFSVSFSVETDEPGPYYLSAYVDANGNGGSEGGFPDEGDYIKVYGGTGPNWPASKNFTITGDHTVNMTLVTVTSNVSGTATLPSGANNKMYTVFVSNLPLDQEGSQGMFMLTKTAQAGTGSTINYFLYHPIPGNYYITLVVDMDDSGFDGDSGPVSTGDFAGIYGVTPPIVNWMSPFPAAPNAAIPATGLNISCTTVPDFSTPYEPPTPAPTPDATAVGEGTISGTITIPSGQSGKGLFVAVDMDLNPTNDNSVGQYQVTLASESSLAYTINNVPAGTYYIYAGATNGDVPLVGDAVGVYGTTYPSFPASSNAVVTGGSNLTANITMAVAAANMSGRVYMPSSVTIGRQWGVVLDYDMDGGNDNSIGMTMGIISTSQNYFDYSMLLPLPGTYYVYAIVDSAEPYDLFTNGPSCDDYFGFYSMPMPVYFSPSVNNTNINITTAPNDSNCP